MGLWVCIAFHCIAYRIALHRIAFSPGVRIIAFRVASHRVAGWLREAGSKGTSRQKEREIGIKRTYGHTGATILYLAT